MLQNSQGKIRLYVLLVGLASSLTLAIAWHVRLEFPGFFALGSFLAVAVLVHLLNTQLRVHASGSIAFVVYLTSGILFGAFWAGTIAGVATIVAQRLQGTPALRVAFNAAQRILSLTGSLLIYQTLGGTIPPEYLKASGSIAPTALQYDLFLFFVYAGLYFIINSVLVSGAISISHGKRFKEVWTLNTRGILAYDLGASIFAIFLAWLYIRAQAWVPLGLGSASLVAVIFPVVVLRHIYGMYHRLQQNGRELLQVMVKAIEARDPYTSGHSIRVAALSRGIAAEMGLSTKKLEEINSAGLLHDVGKIHEEFAPLLRKAEKLTDEEFALLQTHSLKSAELVGIITSFRGPIQNMVRSHHERWDGGGYPDGLAQEEIPLGSRIIMVADTIDAMTTDRPYRQALTVDSVIAELQRCSGTQFDPALVDLAISSLGIRRMISEAGGEQEQLGAQPSPGRSKRVVWSNTFRKGHG